MKDFFNYKYLKAEGLIGEKPRVLDLGCGEGKYLIPFIEQGAEVIAIDKNHTGTIAERVAIEKGDIETYSPQGTFDVIMMRNVLPFVPYKPKVKEIIDRMFDALNPHGVLIFTLFGVDDAWSGTSPNMSFVTNREWKDMLPVLPYATNEFVGLGLTMKGSKKHWQIYSTILLK